jgi:hypothetical protein
MRGKVASLNASVAGSVFLFEAAAQRDLPESERPQAGAVEAIPRTGPGDGDVGATVESSDDLVRPADDAPETAAAGVGAGPDDEPDMPPAAEGADDELLPEAPGAPAAEEGA